jgi:hypothetical protein
MSSNINEGSDPRRSEGQAKAGEAEAVRQAFAALPFEQKISTLLKIEFDLLGDAADTVVSVVSRAADEISQAFNQAGQSTTGQPNTGSQTPTS